IREQVVALTGQRYLDGYSNDEEQFKALMDAGIAFGKQYNLTPGVALTAEQMALLTGDIVWLVNTTVTLPDGSTQTVQVPQVYARVKPGDVNSAGALIAGRDMVMKLDGDLFNSGKLAGKQTVQLSAENIHNQAGTIQGANVSLTARTDINSTGGLLQATDSLLAMAGRDISLTTTTRTAQSDAGQNHFERTSIDSVAGVYVQNDQGRLVLQAGRDINLTAATVVNQGKDSLTQLSAGRGMTLSTVTTSAQDNIIWDKNNRLSQGVTQSTGSTLAGTGEVNKAANVAAHAVVNAALAVAQGNNALAGAAGAATGEVVGMIATQMYGKPVSELSEAEKQTVSTLATVAAGLAGGLVGDSGASAVAGAQSGKTTVENNMLNVIATETAANTAAAIAGATGNASKDTGNDNGWDIGGGCEGSREQCAVRDPSRDGSRGPGHVLNGDNTDENKQPNLGKDVASATDKEKAELGGAGAGTPGGWGPDNEEKARHQEVQQQRFDELSKIYDKSHPVGELTVDGQTIRQSSVSNRYGTTKVFESQNLTDKQIHNYAQQLAGDTPLKEVRPGIYTAKLDNGTSITLRNLSSSQEQTGARWTIDIKGNKQLSDIAYKYKDVEIKFK
ncbi:VENN motif pre-toxin domain-containing protein, partial [Escherichia coli]|uniref:VENN motif pre-toxin domain-containing protein n=1 Tax=Escherichia coli TaxID=562 RepID=UPI0034DAF509